jgi:ATP-dependent transcriptional regulator
MRMSRPDTHGSTRSRGRADAYDPVLTAKVTMPDLPGWAVARPRIDKLIADGTQGPLTLVAGPPGAGKTMAIAAWAAASRNPGALAWLTVDGHDNRPRVFWSYVVAALRRAGVAVPRIRFGPGRVAVDHAFLANLASALAAHDHPRCWSSTTSICWPNRRSWTVWPTCCGMPARACISWSPPGWTRCCRCTGTGSPATGRNPSR